jgi:uncharacterized membrane protein
MGVNGNFYKILLFLHVATAIAGFGAVGWNALHAVRGGRGGPADGADPTDVNDDITRVAEFVIYAVFILGILLVATSRSAWKFSQGWLSASMALYIVAIAVLHGFIRRNQKEYRRVAAELASAPSSGAGRPPEVDRLDHLQQRVAIGWGVFDVIVLVVLWLMLFTPGTPGH